MATTKTLSSASQVSQNTERKDAAMDECKQALSDEEMEQVNGGATVTVCDNYQCPKCGSQVEKWVSKRILGCIVQFYCPSCKERIAQRDLVEV